MVISEVASCVCHTVERKTVLLGGNIAAESDRRDWQNIPGDLLGLAVTLPRYAWDAALPQPQLRRQGSNAIGEESWRKRELPMGALVVCTRLGL